MPNNLEKAKAFVTYCERHFNIDFQNKTRKLPLPYYRAAVGVQLYTVFGLEMTEAATLVNVKSHSTISLALKDVVRLSYHPKYNMEKYNVYFNVVQLVHDFLTNTYTNENPNNSTDNEFSQSLPQNQIS